MKSLFEITLGSERVHLDPQSVDAFKDMIGYFLPFKTFNKKKIKVFGHSRFLRSAVEARDHFVDIFKLSELEVHVEEDREWRLMMT